MCGIFEQWAGLSMGIMFGILITIIICGIFCIILSGLTVILFATVLVCSCLIVCGPIAVDFCSCGIIAVLARALCS